MSETSPKVEFALGSEVSPGHFFKSTFARSFVTSRADSSKSLDYEFGYDTGTIVEEEHQQQHSPGRCHFNSSINSAASHSAGNSSFYSLVDFGPETEQPNSAVWSVGQQRSPVSGATQPTSELNELEKLRKQCQTLTEENERLQASLRTQPAHVQVIDNVYLQNQVDTLQWQLKQSEANRQMYRSLMEQVVRFLDRARKSLDIIHEKSASKRNSNSHNNSSLKEKSRVPRSRSVHAVHADHNGSPNRCMTASSSCASSTTSSGSSASSTSSSSSRFSRAKSVAQISGNGSSGTTSGLRDFTWSVLRRNDPVHCTPPRTKPPPPPVPQASVSVQDVNKTQDSVVYRRPKQSELDPDDVPPEKLSQEAFRLMRTVQSLLVMREPDLARLGSSQEVNGGISPLPLDQHPANMSSLSLHSNFANSTALQQDISSTSTTATTLSGGSSSEGRGTDGSSCTDDEINRTIFGGANNASSKLASNGSSANVSTTTLMSPGARQSIDATSLNSASSKNTEDDDCVSSSRNSNLSGLAHKQDSGCALQQNGYHVQAPTSTPHNRRLKKLDRKELHLKSLRDWALGNSSSSVTSRPKPAASVSSAEDESGFSSMSSFQEVGLPHVVANLSPIKGGCHTEVGLPEVPIEKTRHRRWSSTPAEFQALFKRHSGSFASNGQTTAESLSVWV
ncbi:flocculation protein FLO11 isoform X2 [Nasonia vitripennis]|uniref:Uncharacterized protein n=1 Tax=Nasonia vitripennis TaxID=7425 RepID=A0A7M7Q9B8_NASVI|nr:flocculation protein FLO11 isoform X2 [Nasonia vitripennis]